MSGEKNAMNLAADQPSNFEEALKKVQSQREQIVAIRYALESIRDKIFGPPDPVPSSEALPDKQQESVGFYQKLDRALGSNRRELEDLQNIVNGIKEQV